MIVWVVPGELATNEVLVVRWRNRSDSYRTAGSANHVPIAA